MSVEEDVFREVLLFTQEDILRSLELFIEHEELNEDPRHSEEIVKNRVKLCKRFASAVQKCKLPALTALWWFYEYQFLENRMELNLCLADDLVVEDGEICSMTSSVARILLTVECDYLTVEQFAAMHNVETVTVRRWISRGRLRYAKKIGHDWLIPDTEDKPERGFTSVQYALQDDAHIESSEFPLLAVCKSVLILQDKNDRSKFACYFNNHSAKFRSELELTRKDVERLELALIESGKAGVEGHVQFVPCIRRMED